MRIYLIGSLRNEEVPIIGNRLREEGYEVFDDWYAAGPEADDKWRDYEKGRGHSYIEGLSGYAADHVFSFDKHHLDRSEAGILVLPAGKSGHLELGYLIGKGRPGYILLDTPDRWDVMYKFATGVHTELEDLIADLSRNAGIAPEREEHNLQVVTERTPCPNCKCGLHQASDSRDSLRPGLRGSSQVGPADYDRISIPGGSQGGDLRRNELVTGS